METKRKFFVNYTEEAFGFLQGLDEKVRIKILYNIDKASYCLDPQIFKKLEGQDIWEFRTLYAGIQYRLLAFWDHDTETCVIATHGFVKKTQKTPLKEIERANAIRNEYFLAKQQENIAESNNN